MKFSDDVRRQFDVVANEYDKGRRCFIPCYDDYYVRSVSLLKTILPDIHTVADLGAGSGLLTEQLYFLYPNAKFTLIDLSDKMVEIARKRFHGLSNFDFIVGDFSKGLPQQYDCICSALSIHHLENEEKQEQYNLIFKSLVKGGCFILLDQFCADAPTIDRAFNDWWLDYIDNSGITEEEKVKWLERKKLDREISVTSTLGMLRNAGFKQVECVYEFMKFATIIAIKE